MARCFTSAKNEPQQMAQGGHLSSAATATATAQQDSNNGNG